MLIEAICDVCKREIKFNCNLGDIVYCKCGNVLAGTPLGHRIHGLPRLTSTDEQQIPMKKADAGRVWFNTTTDKFMLWNGVEVVEIK